MFWDWIEKIAKTQWLAGKDTMPVELTGRNVEEIFIFNALAITDTAIRYSSTIDLTRYKQVRFIAKNTLDQSVSLWLGAGIWSGGSGGQVTYFKPDGTSSDTYTSKITISAASNPVLLDNIWADILEGPFKQVVFGVVASTAPTSGSFTLKAWGVIN